MYILEYILKKTLMEKEEKKSFWKRFFEWICFLNGETLIEHHLAFLYGENLSELGMLFFFLGLLLLTILLSFSLKNEAFYSFFIE